MIPELTHVPELLQEGLASAWSRLFEAFNEEQQQFIEKKLTDQQLVAQLNKVLGTSKYLENLWVSNPQYLLEMLADETSYKQVGKEYFSERLSGLTIQSDIDLDRSLRIFRKQQMSRFIFQDVNRLCTTEQIIRELSWFADACIQLSVDWHYNNLKEKHGLPVGEESGEVQPFVVLGMGKLGAHELNLSSDIDLMFCYPESGMTDGKKSIDNQKFFVKVGQGVIKSLDKITIDGFVFRVDMRLRPYGQSGALVLNFDAMELYYEDQGREWERYAMIKARCVAGSQKAGAELLKRLRPFVYRRYTDFSAIQALRDMKAMINREVRRLGKQDDVKLGAGGIREIEFIAQAYQLIYGGREKDLQERSLLKVLVSLGEKGMFSDEVVRGLLDAYCFLRNAEHAIQALNDEQTQRLPIEENAQQRMIYALDYFSWEDFLADFQKHRTLVREHFEDVVAEAEEEDVDTLGEWQEIWADSDVEHFICNLKEKGFSEEEQKQLGTLKSDARIERMESVARERMNTFMPSFLSRLQATEDRGDSVASLIALIEAVLRRTAYLVLFNENPGALERLIVIAKASPWVMQQLVRHPVLLDELISAEGLGHVPEAGELQELLRQQSLRLAIDDVEGHMEMLRYFRLAHHLHIVAAEASGTLPLMKVSDYLSFMADAILEYVVQLAWQQMVEKYGSPSCVDSGCDEAAFAIIGYGKLGGIELSHTSDLDLIFLYEADVMGETDGAKPVENRVFFSRLGQRIIHLLTTRTMLDRLYEVDTRLRPSGNKGLLVNTLPMFDKYQQEDAWTWEHQALVRARPVAGSAKLIEKFEEVRRKTLQKSRDQDELRKDVIEMREKMHDHLAPAHTKAENAEVFHLKHSRGGIVDIEFMVQYLVLAWSHLYPELTVYTDNIRILQSLAKTGLMSEDDAQALIEAYQAYRSEGHKLALKQEKNEAPIASFARHHAKVKAMWDKIFLAG